MRIVDPQEMKDLEQFAIKEYGLDEALIIENVGIRGADFIEKELLKGPHEIGKKLIQFTGQGSEIDFYNQNYLNSFMEISFLIGKGNNGADGLAVARNLANRGHHTRAFILFPDEAPSEELVKQLELAKSYGVKVNETSRIDALQAYFTQALDKILVIDAICGTGFRPPLSQFLFELINLINDCNHPVVSLDIPSGITGLEGAAGPTAIEADYTLAIGNLKTGHIINDGPRFSGEMTVLDVGLPAKLDKSGNKFVLGLDRSGPKLIKRSKFAHKNTYGHALMVGGEYGLTGALIMASEAALKTGAGLVTAATWPSNYSELANRVPPEVMIGKIPEGKKEIDEFLRFFDRYDSVVVGPGMGRNEKTRNAVLDILNNFSGPVVIDADAINVLRIEEDKELFRSRKAPTVLTPHIGEFSRLAQRPKEEIMGRPLQALKSLVDDLSSTVVLKGPSTYIGLPNGKVYVNYMPNDGMAKGGSGDILAGIVGGLLAHYAVADEKNTGIFLENESYYNAVCLGVWAHSLAGIHASETIGARSMTARSILDGLGPAFKTIESKGN